MKHTCQISHPQIESGVCPWCNELLGGHDAVPATTATVWNISAMLIALMAPEDDVRSMTVTNLFCDGLSTDVAIPLFSMALSDRSERIRNLAECGLSRRGRSMTVDDAQRFEAQIPGAEHELVLRILLLGHYFIPQRESEAIKAARHEHIFWIIRNAPDSNCAGSSYASIHGQDAEQAYATAKSLWLEQVATHPNNSRILGNAARFFLLKDWELSEDFLRRASQIEPNNPAWPEQLGQLYSLQGKRDSAFRKINVEKAFRELQIAAQLQKGDEDTNESAGFGRLFALPDLAKSAFEAEHFDDAHKYAAELLELVACSNEPEHVFPTGNAVHHGNLILGRLALRNGDVEQAKAHLLAAGRTLGSPQLNSFGPNMALAKELLEQNERDVVLEFFQLCAQFWKHDSARLDEWASQVKVGNVPKFGPNLVY